MRKYIVAGLVLLFLISIGCTQRPTPYFAPQRITQNVYRHIVSIAVYYYMPEEEWTRRMYMRSEILRVPVEDGESTDGKPVKAMAYIGSGTIMKDNHILTVRHLFDHNENTYSRKIWVFHQDTDHPIEADLIAITEKKEEKDYYNDYAVIRMRENLGLPGIALATKPVQLGEKVMFGCSVGGTAFFLRFGYASMFKWFFRRDDNGRLHLSYWTQYHFVTMYPSGAGDSGSGVFNIRGYLVGVSYIGLNIHEEMYVFSNPLDMLWKFLEKHHLKYLGYAHSSD